MPLAAGEQRHVLSVFVADEAGLINQVSRIFNDAGAPQIRDLHCLMQTRHSVSCRQSKYRYDKLRSPCREHRNSCMTAGHGPAGKNIESLAVGLNVDTAIFTITIAGTADEANALLQELDKLEKVGGAVN